MDVELPPADPVVNLRGPGLGSKIAYGVLGYVIGALSESILEVLIREVLGTAVPNRTLICGIAGAAIALGRLKRKDETLPVVASGNYFGRHWRGQLPLGISYWLNGGVGTVLASHVDYGIVRRISGLETNYLALIGVLSLWLFHVPLVIWQLVGIWRSASRPDARGEPPTAGGLAKVGVALGVAYWLAIFGTQALPTIRAALEQANWLERNARWQNRVLRGGAELEISGGIGPGFARQLKSALDANPGVRLVHLNLGVGGLVAEAKNAREIVRDRGLSTYVSASCVSACTLVYLGGVRRYMKRSARLGFHAPSAVGVTGYDLKTLLDVEKEYMVNAGLSREFASRVVATPHESMWFPSAEELSAGGVVTELTSGDAFALSTGAQPPDLERTRAIMGKNRGYRAIAGFDPEAYSKLLQLVHDALARGESMQELRGVTIPIIRPISRKAFPRSSDAALLRYARLMVAEMTEIHGAAPELCPRLIEGTASPAEEASITLSSAVRNEELEVLADAIESADPARRAPSAKETKRLLARTLSRLRRASGAVGVLAGCPAAIGLFSAIGQLPPAEGATLVRGILTMQ